MLSTGTPPDWASVDVAVPRQSDRLPGVRMAGFRQHVPALVDIAMVAHPSVTLFVDLSEGDGIVYDAHGRHERGSVVAGLIPGGLRAGGWAGECLQIRLSPVVAFAARFDHAAHLLAAGHAAARVAAESGYVDQSHLHREVKALTGVTPHGPSRRTVARDR